jgi:hypothetical protein
VSAIVRAFRSPGQSNVQVALLQLRVQAPVQVMLQVELPPHVMVPPGATTGLQVELPSQSRLHELTQAPPQVVWFVHKKEQGPPSLPQFASVKEQLFPALQMHVAPAQTGAGAVEDPQAPRTRTRTRMAGSARMRR